MQTTEEKLTEATQKIGRRIAARRKSLALTQEEAADLAGVSVRFLSSLENGKPTARLNGVLAVLSTLGIEFLPPERDRV